MGQEITELPVDDNITGSEELVVVDVDDASLGKKITVASLEAHLAIPEPVSATNQVAYATEISGLPTLGTLSAQDDLTTAQIDAIQSGTTADDVGLSMASNTSDADKPVSTAQQTALDNKLTKPTGFPAVDEESIVAINNAGVVRYVRLDTLGVTDEGLTNIVLDDLAFTGTAQTANITVTGDPATQFSLAVVSTDPLGWLTSGALGATSGTIPADGTFETTLSIPAVTVTVNRAAALQAINSLDATDVVTTGLFRQIHNAEVVDNDLVFSASALVVGTMTTFSVDITAGDQPFTLELFDADPDVGSPTPLQTQTQTAIGTYAFTAIDTTTFPVGDNPFFLRVTDTDGDTAVEMETITIADEDGEGTGANDLSTNRFSFWEPDSTTDYNVVLFNPPVDAGGNANIRYEMHQGLVADDTPFSNLVVVRSSSGLATTIPPGAGSGFTVNFGNVNQTHTYRLFDASVSPEVLLVDSTTRVFSQDPLNLEVGRCFIRLSDNNVRFGTNQPNTDLTDGGFHWVYGSFDVLPDTFNILPDTAFTGTSRSFSEPIPDEWITGPENFITIRGFLTPNLGIVSTIDISSLKT